MSTHHVNVVKIENLEKHPNADTLSIVKVKDYTCIVRNGDLNIGDLAIYIPPDYVVPNSSLFAFLGEHRRIKVKKLRGLYSQGLLLPCPKDINFVVGDDVMETLAITHYEPPLPRSITHGDAEKAPNQHTPVYDVENLRDFPDLLSAADTVVVTEKIHGANGRYLFFENRIWCGSRTQWKKQAADNMWWRCLEQNPWVTVFCERHPGLILYGEVYGQVQDLRYGTKPGEYRFAVFDVFDPLQALWLPYAAIKKIGNDIAGFAMVPEIYVGAFDRNKIKALAEINSAISPQQIREGVVVEEVTGRTDNRLEPLNGRIKLKLVSNRYLERY